MIKRKNSLQEKILTTLTKKGEIIIYSILSIDTIFNLCYDFQN